MFYREVDGPCQSGWFEKRLVGFPFRLMYSRHLRQKLQVPCPPDLRGAALWAQEHSVVWRPRTGCLEEEAHPEQHGHPIMDHPIMGPRSRSDAQMNGPSSPAAR